MSKNRKRKLYSGIDISLLSCGLVDNDVFSACLDAIAREAGGVDANVSVYLNGAPQESRNFFVAEIEKHGFLIKQTSERVGFPAGVNENAHVGCFQCAICACNWQNSSDLTLCHSHAK